MDVLSCSNTTGLQLSSRQFFGYHVTYIVCGRETLPSVEGYTLPVVMGRLLGYAHL